MSEDPGDERDLPAGDEEDSGDDELEAKGLGLTEEFARLEAEIEDEAGGPPSPSGEDRDSEDPEEPRTVRFDETDSAEWVAPVTAGPSRETDEWAAAGEDAFEGSEAPAEEEPEAGALEPDAGPDEPQQPGELEVDPAGGEVPDAPTPPSAADSPATEHTVIQPRAAAPVPIAAGGHGWPGGAGIDEADIEDKTPALWWRFLTGSVMVVASIATAVALSSLLALNSIAEDLQPIPGVKPFITTIDPGAPQTILVIGSDKRSNTPGDPGRSDTTMLLRVDAGKDVLALFSLPRDLKVDIAGKNFGEAKLNEAFTDGGVKKTLATVKDLTGLEINHVVNVDFQGFADAVDAIDCVYVDVDRDYFNDNSQAFSVADQFATIDVNAGYQRLCGLNALDYVRYRHTDNDFVRAARQQDFLRNARAQVSVKEVLPIIGNGDTSSNLIDIFTKYTSSDIRDPGSVIDVLKAFIGVRDVPINEVHFNGSDTIENGISYVTATPEQIKKAVDQFLGEEDTAGGPASEPAPPSKSEKKPDEKKKPKDPGSSANLIPIDDTYAGFGRTSARRLKFPVYIPQQVAAASLYSKGSRQYDIKDTDDNKQPAYKMVIALNSDTTAGLYYGVEGTTWNDPPILDNASETRTIDGRDYDLYYDGDRLRIVAFHDAEGNSYWVSNTLLQTLSDDEMLAIAASMQEAHG